MLADRPALRGKADADRDTRRSGTKEDVSGSCNLRAALKPSSPRPHRSGNPPFGTTCEIPHNWGLAPHVRGQAPTVRASSQTATAPAGAAAFLLVMVYAQ